MTKYNNTMTKEKLLSSTEAFRIKKKKKRRRRRRIRRRRNKTKVSNMKIEKSRYFDGIHNGKNAPTPPKV